MTRLFATNKELNKFLEEHSEEINGTRTTTKGILVSYDENILVDADTSENYIVFRLDSGKFIYEKTNDNTTFIEEEAKRYAWKDAVARAYYRSMNAEMEGIVEDWDVLKI